MREWRAISRRPADAAWRLQCAEAELAQAHTALLEQRALCERQQAELTCAHGDLAVARVRMAELDEHGFTLDAVVPCDRAVPLDTDEGTDTLYFHLVAHRR